MQFLSKAEYESQIAASRDKRMEWWREARFGMFVHLGLFTVLQRHEWAMAMENFTPEEYETLADSFQPEEGAPRAWAKLASEAGMKYMVLTTRHHEGFSLWDSKVNPFNSVNYGPHRDIVKEFVEACREYGLRIGFYSSMMDWRHPDGGIAAYDSAARKRFTDYIYALNEELLTQYGKIDILWYDVPSPMEHQEGWNSLELNQKLRALQPDIIINNRCWLDEDFGTPEERITAGEKDWESCMTFNGLSWGYIDSDQVKPYSYNAQGILKMLSRVTNGGGNLLLNIGPAPDGSVPHEAYEPLHTVGNWLRVNGEAVYGKVTRSGGRSSGSFLCSCSYKNNIAYYWLWIWPNNGELRIGGYFSKLKSARIVSTGREIAFEQDEAKIILKGLTEADRDPHANVGIIAFEFEEAPRIMSASLCRPLNGGTGLAGLRELSEKGKQ